MLISAQYVDWVKTGDLAAEWADEPACRAYGYKADSDMFKGTATISSHLRLLLKCAVQFTVFISFYICQQLQRFVT